MDFHSACCALLSGAALLAVTATAAPSPCLAQRPPTATDQRPPAQQHRPWRNPCYLADAEKIEEEETTDGAGRPRTLQELLDEIEMLGRIGPEPLGERPLLWVTYEAPQAEGALPAVPEPASAAMLAAGLAMLAGVAWRRPG